MQRLGELTQYGSSDEGEASESSPPPAKRRKLPSLPESLRPGVPIDDPALHQGRVRTSPHVEGQYAAYVYLPLIVERRSPLHKLLSKAFASAKRAVPSLHSIGLPELPQTGNIQPHSVDHEDDHVLDVELHISLTRPVYLRAYQREDLKRAVKAIAKSHLAFPASLASFSELTNDERTRTFLAVEIGAGHDQLKILSDGLIPALRSLKQKEFYTEPRFHASFAWALLHGTYPSATTTENSTSPSAAATPSPGPLSASMSTDPTHPESNSGKTAAESSPNIFPTIPRFPPSLVHSLNDEFGEMLRARHVGTFDAREVHVKIGKDVFKWTLSGE
ncbi:uncharacterized protein B0H18DRAFT_1017184 [Fomitopsis serialis]|uniref:uncharacterized protein n=1 Tax=Fomitopsis serialis TaxID=139415 RepID=UPI0020078D60|nr:uncharacterized protein B0H18DRAFT_1017184 [Neoantrodia serialis]KAH9922637.1 hypothetical protein B0H18DRAFT_1017184 [Neoantrodia serialis]